MVVESQPLAGRSSYYTSPHPEQYIFKHSEEKVYALGAQTSLLGLPVNDKKVYQDEMGIGEGDRIFLFTDGIIETMNSSKEEYGPARVKEFLLKHSKISADAFNKKLLEELDGFKCENFKDDICMLDILLKEHAHLFTWHKQ